MRADVFLKAEYQEYNGSSAELHSNLIKTKKQNDLDNILKFDNDSKKTKCTANDKNDNANEVSNQDSNGKCNFDENYKCNKIYTTASYEEAEIKETLIRGLDDEFSVDDNNKLNDECIT